MQHVILHCNDEKRRLVDSPILAVFLLWRLSIYQAAIFCRIDGFEKRVIVDYTFLTLLNRQKNFLRKVQALQQLEIYCP